MFISIIVPSFNEEQYIPRLLKSLTKQTYRDFEVIIADAFSRDRTREIAESFGAQIVDGGLPAAGRNNGAAVARGDYLFFFDSDIILPTTFLENAVSEIQEKSIHLAGCEARPLSTRLLDKVLHKFAYVGMKITRESNPRLPGYCILISRDIFNTVGGFDETIRVGEDLNLVTRAVEYTPLNLLESTHVFVSVRRFDKEGRASYLRKSIRVHFYRKYRGEIKDEKDIPYEFGTYGKKESKDFELLLNRIQQRLENLEKRIARVQERRGEIPDEIVSNFTEIANTLSALLDDDDGNSKAQKP